MSRPDIRLASFAAVVILYLPVIVCKNAAISGCADSRLVNSSLTLKCQYIENGDVVAVYWKNGSHSNFLVLRPGSKTPHCDLHAIDASFDPHRINYTCNASSKVYTLTINTLQKEDNNVNWSCTFLDSAFDYEEASCTIHLSDVTAGDGRISSSESTVTIIIVLCISLITVAVIIIVIILWRRKRNTCKTCYGHNQAQNAEVHGEQVENHREQEPDFASTWDKEDPQPLLASVQSTKQDGHNQAQNAEVNAEKAEYHREQEPNKITKTGYAGLLD